MTVFWPVEAVKQAVDDRAITLPRRLMSGWPTISRPRGRGGKQKVVQNKRRLGTTKFSHWLAVFLRANCILSHLLLVPHRQPPRPPL